MYAFYEKLQSRVDLTYFGAFFYTFFKNDSNQRKTPTQPNETPKLPPLVRVEKMVMGAGGG